MTRDTRLTSTQSLATLTRINRYNLRLVIQSIRLLNSLVCVDPRRKISILALSSVNPRLLISVVLFIPDLSIYLIIASVQVIYLSFLPLPISQSYPRQRKIPDVSQSRERQAFSGVICGDRSLNSPRQ